jgi:hypothetical protein
MAEFFYAPTGVAGYWLRIMEALDQPLGPPQNLAGTLVTGGSLAEVPTYWVVTALDGAGGETTVSNELTLTPSGGDDTATLTWNQVPNAVAYNIYRGTSSGGEVLLTGTGLPATTNAYTDDGSASASGGVFDVSAIASTGGSGARLYGDRGSGDRLSNCGGGFKSSG